MSFPVSKNVSSSSSFFPERQDFSESEKQEAKKILESVKSVLTSEEISYPLLKDLQKNIQELEHLILQGMIPFSEVSTISELAKGVLVNHRIVTICDAHHAAIRFSVNSLLAASTIHKEQTFIVDPVVFEALRSANFSQAGCFTKSQLEQLVNGIRLISLKEKLLENISVNQNNFSIIYETANKVQSEALRKACLLHFEKKTGFEIEIDNAGTIEICISELNDFETESSYLNFFPQEKLAISFEPGEEVDLETIRRFVTTFGKSIKSLSLNEKSHHLWSVLKDFKVFNEICINNCTNLKSLILEPLDLNFESLLALKIDALEHLSLFGITDFQSLSGENFPNLLSLTLFECRSINETKLENFPHLRSILLHNSFISNPYPKLENLPSLEEFTAKVYREASIFQHHFIVSLPPNENTLHLKNLPQLKSISISAENFNNNVKLKDLPSLETVDFSGCDALNNLPAFDNTPKLQTLNFQDTQIAELPPLNIFITLHSFAASNQIPLKLTVETLIELVNSGKGKPLLLAESLGLSTEIVEHLNKHKNLIKPLKNYFELVDYDEEQIQFVSHLLTAIPEIEGKDLLRFLNISQNNRAHLFLHLVSNNISAYKLGEILLMPDAPSWHPDKLSLKLLVPFFQKYQPEALRLSKYLLNLCLNEFNEFVFFRSEALVRILEAIDFYSMTIKEAIDELENSKDIKTFFLRLVINGKIDVELLKEISPSVNRHEWELESADSALISKLAVYFSDHKGNLKTIVNYFLNVCKEEGIEFSIKLLNATPDAFINEMLAKIGEKGEAFAFTPEKIKNTPEIWKYIKPRKETSIAQYFLLKHLCLIDESDDCYQMVINQLTETPKLIEDALSNLEDKKLMTDLENTIVAILKNPTLEKILIEQRGKIHKDLPRLASLIRGAFPHDLPENTKFYPIEILLIEEDIFAPRHLQIGTTLEDVTNNSIAVLKEFSAFLTENNNPNFQIVFFEEKGVDAGGLSRQFISSLFRGISEKLGLKQSVEKISMKDYPLYIHIGNILSFLAEKNRLNDPADFNPGPFYTGEILHPDYFKGMLAFSAEEAVTAVEMLPNSRVREIISLLSKQNNLANFYRQIDGALEWIESLSFEKSSSHLSFIQEVYDVQGEPPPPLYDENGTLIRNGLDLVKDYLLKTYYPPEKISALHGLLQGFINSPIDLFKRQGAEYLQKLIQGQFEKDHVFDSFEFRFPRSTSEDNKETRSAFFKTWIESKNEAELKYFIEYTTGAPVLPNKPIKACFFTLIPKMAVHSCFNRIDIPMEFDNSQIARVLDEYCTSDVGGFEIE